MILEAGLVRLFRTIFVIFLIYYVFKFLSRYIFPLLLKNWVDKKMGQFQNQSQFNNQQKEEQFAKEHEGEIKIKSNAKSKTETEGIGDEVDFEEIE